MTLIWLVVENALMVSKTTARSRLRVWHKCWTSDRRQLDLPVNDN
jgi:hypothetical protein